MINADDAFGGMLILISDEQPTRIGRPFCAGRRGQLICPLSNSEIVWYVMVYPKGALKGRIAMFDLADLEAYPQSQQNGNRLKKTTRSTKGKKDKCAA